MRPPRPSPALVLALGALAGLGVGFTASAEEPPVLTDVPKDVKATPLAGGAKFQETYYWVTCEDDAKGERDTELLDPKGNSLGKVRADFAKNLRLEGTGRTLEGKTLNWAGNGRYSVVKHPWGTGAKGALLEPFRSLAVDPKEIPIGTRILIPQAIGALLPDGSVHDGVFRADDTGGAIKGKHVDVFCGLKRDMKILQGRGIDKAPLFLLDKDDRKALPPLKFPRPATVRFSKALVSAKPEVETLTAEALEGGKKVTVLAREGAFLKLGEGRWIEALALDLRS